MLQIRRQGFKDKNRPCTILAMYADLDEVSAGDFGQADIEPTESVAGTDY